MTHLHLQLIGRRFNELAGDYLRQISWISEPTADALCALQKTLQAVCSKQQFYSPQSFIFGTLNFQKDVLHFLKPFSCCEKRLAYASALASHLVGGHADCALDVDFKQLVILFNLYLQVTNDILVRYNGNFETIDQVAVEILHKARGFVSCILQKPISADPALASLFIETRFKKWKVVFEYTCQVCESQGVERCRFANAIAWYNVHAQSIVSNSILHVGSKLHIESIRQLPSDRSITSRTLDVNNNEFSSGAVYLRDLRLETLDKECFVREKVTKTTPFTAVEAYLIEQFSAFLGRIDTYFFGSRATGVAEKDSDLDVCIKSRSGRDDNSTYSEVYKWAKAQPNSEVEILHYIPVEPLLIRVHVNALSLTLDLTFGCGFVVADSKLILHYFNMQPLARKMHVSLMIWKKLIKLSKNFHAHVLTRLIIFFMQQRNYLPTVERVLAEPLDQMNKFNVKLHSIDNFLLDKPKDFLSLIKDFFAYWNRFDWTQNGICVRNGMVKPRPWFHFDTDRQSEPLMMSSDYFNQTRNASSNVRAGDFKKFQNACEEADKVLKEKFFI